MNASAEQSERLVWSWMRQTAAVHGLPTPREKDHFSDPSRQANTRGVHHMVQKCTRIAEGRQHRHVTHQDTDAGSIALRDLGLKLNTDDDVDEDTLRRIQLMMHDIFVRRFAGL